MKSYAQTFCIGASLIILACLTGCSDPVVEPAEYHPTADDLVDSEAGKADSFAFDANRLVSDSLFEDADYMSAEDIQGFLEFNPYRQRSYLADYTFNGMSFAQAVYEAAQKHRINPMILLVKIQVESSLIFRTSSPSQYILDHAMGCGCPDEGPVCGRAPKGVFAQVDCAARLMRSYLTALDASSQTVSGWAVGRSKQTSDDKAITPANRATAALYTYTPWVLQGEGGNWLFWNVMRKFSRAFLLERPNHRWIGGVCNSDADCPFEGGTCLFPPISSAEPPGMCTQSCERTCPDSRQPNTRPTFCVNGSEVGLSGAGGLCISQCRTGYVNDCRSGFSCVERERFEEEMTVRNVCLPGVEPAEDLDEQSHTDAEESESESESDASVPPSPHADSESQ